MTAIPLRSWDGMRDSVQARSAHEVDWFDPAMDAAGEERIWDAMHPGVDSITGDHGHSWIDVGA